LLQQRECIRVKAKSRVINYNYFILENQKVSLNQKVQHLEKKIKFS